ncbi:MAG: hypothetical protein WBD20_09745 [Pirellulaceae bacterium]
MLSSLPRYDTSQTYQWNYDHPPDWQSPDLDAIDIPMVDGDWQLCGVPIASPLGISAGPLLNGDWCLYYSRLGFDVLTYKTVRSRQRACYPQPNLVPVDCDQIDGEQRFVNTANQMNQSWAVSYGMPSADPEFWRRDVERTRRLLASEKRLSVSVVGTMQEGWSIDELASDYAQCAKWAFESGADFVETNFSCPNVSTCDGQLYQNPESSAIVAQAVRASIGDTPLILKIGHVCDKAAARQFVAAVGPIADAFAMTNSIAAVIRHGENEMFDGQPRGICGDAIRESSVSQVALFSAVIGDAGWSTQLIGVGGIHRAAHVGCYLSAGATACQLATSAMLDPAVAISIRQELHRLT